MTFEEASKIVNMWGLHIEHRHWILHALFFSSIPESCLPFAKRDIEKALNIVAEHHHYLGNTMAVKDLHRAIAILMFYSDDEKALLQAVKLFSDPKMRDTITSSISMRQEEWLKLQQ